ncbi:MAG: hypothetical protein HYR60_06910 [Acidobacteria bacterium]|nr:hypothetical protein [Acidobacteriota bacterium]
MSAQTNTLLPLASAGLVLALRLYFLVRILWNYPLNHGPGFFLGVEVAPGFYEGRGAQWLRRYRILLLVQHLILVAAFIVPVALRRWSDLPVMAPIDVITLFSLIGGFTFWSRRTLGSSPPRLSSIAAPLEERRLSDYISWPLEAVLVALLAFSWLLLFTRGDAGFRWQSPVLMTYAVMGLLPLKIILVRNSFPLPPERTEEHHRWMEADRRYSLRVMESMRWFLAVTLAAYAVRHGFPDAATKVWLYWSFLGFALAIFLLMAGILIRGSAALAAMSRGLRPVGSWAGPFQPAPVMLHGGLTWSILYCGGLAALLLFFGR